MKRLLTVIVAMGFALVACSSESTAVDPTGTAPAAPESTPAAADPPADSSLDDEADENAGQEETIEAPEGELFPDVVNATAVQDSDGTWTVSATLSSPYDSPDRYADSWRVLGPDGTVFGERFLTHDHAGEQPFTRSQSGIEIPSSVTEVTIQGRDQLSGWGGETYELTLE